ncbi:MAG: hypothetical protein L6416_09540, partial [Candidatus Omnitrophica bacterium]|nr:hypothetical protein [Candidatus Omnitrophota bacterium]
MMKDGIIIFQRNYPNIYSVFESVINELLSEGEKQELFYNLMLAYGLTGNATVDFDECFSRLNNMALGRRHPFFEWLVTYWPNNPLLPPCVNELEFSLQNANIKFEDKTGTLNKLKENAQFWGKYCELEAAANFARAGCIVKILHRPQSKDKYPDLEIEFYSRKINVEVSNRLYMINKNSEINALRNKVEDEAEQLPKGGFNIILFFV